MKHTYIAIGKPIVIGKIDAGQDLQTICEYTVTLTVTLTGRGSEFVPVRWSISSAKTGTGVPIDVSGVSFTPSATSRTIMVTLPQNGDYIFRVTAYPGRNVQIYDEVSVITTPSSYVFNVGTVGVTKTSMTTQDTPGVSYTLSSEQLQRGGPTVPTNPGATLMGASAFPNTSTFTFTVQAFISGNWVTQQTYLNRPSTWITLYNPVEFGVQNRQHRILTLYYQDGVPIGRYASATFTFPATNIASGVSAINNAGTTKTTPTQVSVSYTLIPALLTIQEPVESNILNVGTTNTTGTTTSASYVIIPSLLTVPDPESYVLNMATFANTPSQSSFAVGTIPGGVVIGS